MLSVNGGNHVSSLFLLHENDGWWMRVVLSNSGPRLIHTHNLVPTVLRMCASMHAFLHTCANMYSLTHRCVNMFTVLHIPAQTGIFSHTCVHKCILPHVCSNMYTLTRVQTCTLSVSDMSVQMYIISTHTHTHTHMYALSHKNTPLINYKPTPAQNLPFLRSKGSPSKQDPIKYLYRNDFVLSYRKDSQQCSSQSMV